MHYLKIIPKGFWKLLFLLNFIVGLLILYPLFYLLLLNERYFHLVFQLKRFWAAWILIVPGIFVSVGKRNRVKDLPHPCIYCANHTSYLDIVVSYKVFPKYFVFMGKQELDKAPLFRVFFKKMNILVDRKSNMNSHRAFKRAGEELDKGRSMFLFPEGTISKSSPQMMPFKNGAFKLAIEKQVPIVPVTFANNWKLLQNGGFFKSFGRPGLSKVVVHKPIYTNGLCEEDLLSLKEKVKAVIASGFEA